MNANYLNTRLEKRRNLILAAQGLDGETGSRQSIAGAAAWTSGDQRATLTALLKGEKVTSLYTHITTVGSGFTLAKLGVWTTGGTLLANTADVSGQFVALGIKGGAVTTAYTSPSDQAVYVGGVIVASGMPIIARHGTPPTGYNNQALGSGVPLAAANTGKSDIGTLSITQSSSGYWFGWTVT
jgi:hypothetical protein